MTFPEGAAGAGKRGTRRGGVEMLRATVWTVGLFGAGTAICRAFPWTWTDPLVLLGLGLALLFVSTRTARETRAPEDVRPAATVTKVSASATSAPAPIAAAAAAASVQVEVGARSAPKSKGAMRPKARASTSRPLRGRYAQHERFL